VAFKIADGYVEVHGRLDDPSFRRAAERAGGDAGGHFTNAFDRSVKRRHGRISGIFREMLTPDKDLMRTLLHPIEKTLSIPLVAALAAGIVGHGVTAVAAAIQSAVLLGIGGVVLGGAAFLLKDKLEKPFKSAMDRIGKVLTEAASPLVGPFTKAFDDIADAAERLAPQFERIFTAAGPIIPLLVDSLIIFAEKILPSIEKMMPSIVEMFEVLADRAPEIADAVTELLLAMSKPETIEAFGYLLTGLIFTINLVSDAMGFLTRAFNTGTREIKHAIGIARGAIDTLKGAIGSIPVKWITKYLFSPGAAARAIARITNLTHLIPQRWRTLYRFLSGGAVGAIQRIIAWIGRIPRNVTTTFTSITRNITESITRFLNPLARASGGIVGAQGMQTGGIAGRRAVLVGERGPELAELPFGSRVVPAGQTRAALDRAGREQGPLVIHLHVGGRKIAEVLIDPLRKEVRSLGGDVQAVLGAG
jgi:hypothetical protein